jgi:UDP-3-O-[3-hydroxymyristoyl] glucosamine N-acyltransferase
MPPKKRRKKRPRSPRGAGLSPSVSLEALARELGGELDAGARGLVIERVAPVEKAGPGELAPLLARRYLEAARQSGAAILVDASLAPLLPEGRRWVHPHAPYALAKVLERVAEAPPPEDKRALAIIEAGAEVDETAIIGPGAVILAGAVVGPFARVEPNAVIYGGARVGARAVIGAGAVIGRPGFGWAATPDGKGVVRIPQIGGALIEDDAEVGPLATVDAGTLEPTVVGAGAKLDAHVHVGHNAIIGPGSIVAAQAGFAGSVRVGAGVLVGGQAGVADHVTVGDGARLAAKAGVIGDVPPRAVFAGYPAVDRGRWLRATARMLAGERTKRSRP